jgi:hypothetical protein
MFYKKKRNSPGRTGANCLKFTVHLKIAQLKKHSMNSPFIAFHNYWYKKKKEDDHDPWNERLS